MRVIFMLFVCFAIALQGVAGAHALDLHCPMQQDMSAMADSAAQMHACCNDADTLDEAGQFCKTELPCGTSGSCVLPSLGILPHTQPTATLAFAEQPSALVFNPADVWRPPTR